MRGLLLAAFLASPVLASQVAAQEVRDCDALASISAIAEPWEANSKTFANDRVRLVVIDTLEPAAAAFHLLILSPPYDAVGGRQCKMVGMAGQLGFASLSLDGITSSYDPAKGLTWVLTANVYDAATGGFVAKPLSVTINQSSGAITATLN